MALERGFIMANSATLHTVLRPTWKAFKGQNHVAYSVAYGKYGEFTVTNYKAKVNSFDIYLRKNGCPIQVRLGTLGKFDTVQAALAHAKSRINTKISEKLNA